MWIFLSDIYLIICLQLQKTFRYWVIWYVCCAIFLEGGDNSAPEKIGTMIMYNITQMSEKLPPHQNRKNQTFYVAKHFIDNNGYIEVPLQQPLISSIPFLIWHLYGRCSALFLANHCGSCEASLVLSSTVVFEAKRPFNMWYLSLMVYLTMATINLFYPYTFFCIWSIGIPDPIHHLVCSGEQTKLWRWNLLPSFGVTLFLLVNFFFFIPPPPPQFHQVYLHMDLNRNLQSKLTPSN